MRNVDRLIEGLQILKSYGDVCVCGKHDRLKAGWEDEINVSDVHQKRLEELYWEPTLDPDYCLQWELPLMGTEED